MELTIEQSCPSCGASIVLREDDRLVRCEYCDVLNFRLDNGAGRYILPSKVPGHIDPADIFYTPYLRFKGTIFYVCPGEVRHKIVDTTRIGIDDTTLPVSLGLRPQAMNLKPVVTTMPGGFLQQSVPTKAAFGHASMVAELFSGKGDRTVYHRAFIGETLSRIYQPCYCHEGVVYDAVLNQALGPDTEVRLHTDKSSVAQASWEPQFISTICPECGSLLAGASDSLVLHCRNCESLWQEEAKKFQPVAWRVVESSDPGTEYLPFWKIGFSVDGEELNNFGDYLRFTNQPMVAERFDARPLIFWVPAFKLNPRIFLQVAGKLTVSQWRIPPGRKKWVTCGHPVTLNQQEAVQAIKSILAATTLNKDNRLPLLPKMTIVNTQCELAFLPFSQQSLNFVQEHTSIAVLAAALKFGRKL